MKKTPSILIVALAAALIASTDDASAIRLYWTSGASVYSSELDGSDVMLHRSDFPEPYLHGLAIDNLRGLVYVGNTGSPSNQKLWYANLDGSGVVQAFPNTGGWPYDVELDTVNDKVYWCGATTEIRSSDWNGSNWVVEMGSPPLSQPDFRMVLDVANDKVYLSNYYLNMVAVADLTLGTLTTLVNTPGKSEGVGVDFVNSKIYYTVVETASSNNGIYWADLDGGNPAQLVSVPGASPRDVVVYHESASSYLFWMEDTRIVRANLDGTGQFTAAAWSNISGLRALEIGSLPNSSPTPAELVDVTVDGTNCTVYWSSLTGQVYSVYKSGSPVDTWPVSPLSSNIPGDPSGTNSYPDATATNRAAFYKIRTSRR